jgi:hypothetical protein
MRDGGNDIDVCIDGHMANLVRGEKRPLKGIHLTRIQFDTMAEAFRLAAREIGIQPCQLQAALWLGWRASGGFRQGRIEFDGTPTAVSPAIPVRPLHPPLESQTASSLWRALLLAGV